MGRAGAWAHTGTNEWARQAWRALALVFAALALMLQANAPVQAAMMATGSDLPANLCASHAPGQDHHSPIDRDAACAACAVCIAGATTAVLSAALSLFPPASTVLFRQAPGRSTSIRGPPARAPNARAPPVSA